MNPLDDVKDIIDAMPGDISSAGMRRALVIVVSKAFTQYNEQFSGTMSIEDIKKISLSFMEIA